jgi:hypothetical protein
MSAYRQGELLVVIGTIAAVVGIAGALIGAVWAYLKSRRKP